MWRVFLIARYFDRVRSSSDVETGGQRRLRAPEYS